MSQSVTDTCASRAAVGRWLCTCILVALFCLLSPTATLAAPDHLQGTGPDQCAQCHPAQTETWQASPHAHAQIAESGVTCQACHGEYVADHPTSGTMRLQVGASPCQECHTSTYEQWHETAHAGSSVACTGCHVPHSQQTRISGEELCASCHREVVESWAHHKADIHCTDCHLPQSPAPASSTDVRVMSGKVAPDHAFEAAVVACVECHSENLHDAAFNDTAVQMDWAQLPAMTERSSELAYELEDARRSNRRLQATSVVSLGFGLGAGAVMGAVFVLIVGYVAQGSTRE